MTSDKYFDVRIDYDGQLQGAGSTDVFLYRYGHGHAIR